MHELLGFMFNAFPKDATRQKPLRDELAPCCDEISDVSFRLPLASTLTELEHYSCLTCR